MQSSPRKSGGEDCASAPAPHAYFDEVSSDTLGLSCQVVEFIATIDVNEGVLPQSRIQLFEVRVVTPRSIGRVGHDLELTVSSLKRRKLCLSKSRQEITALGPERLQELLRLLV